MKLIRPLLKLGLGSGVIYFAVEQGLFSDSQKESIESSKRVINAIPGLDPYLEKVLSVMSKEELKSYWNSGVKITISALASFPDDSQEAISKGLNYLKDEIKNQMKNVSK